MSIITLLKSWRARKNWIVKQRTPKGYTGGPARDFERAGRLQLIMLLRCGLEPEHKVLDVGCGCLRGGRFIARYLYPQNYFGIEPNVKMLQLGLKRLYYIPNKQIDTNDSFDFQVFDTKFDYVLARSIWTHASKGQIKTMLDEFNCVAANSDSIFMTSYIKPGVFKRDYKGTKWHGRSHNSDVRGCIAHSFKWIKRACAERGLDVRELPWGVYNNQRWLCIRQKGGE